MVIECIADRWGLGESERIKAEKTSDGVIVDGRKVANMEYNGIQLRFEMTEAKTHDQEVYIVFDNRSGSSMTIKEMYEKLK